MNNRLDEMGCTPHCASHLVFGVQTMDATRCETCDLVDAVNEANSAFIEQFYVHEMLSVYERLPPAKKDIHEVFKAIIKGDSDFRIQNRAEKKVC